MTTRAPALERFRSWARTASYGDEYVYHLSRAARDEALFEYARKLSEAGLVFLAQQRTTAGKLLYTARRCSIESRSTLDKVSRSMVVQPTTAFRTEEGATGVGRPRKAQMGVAA